VAALSTRPASCWSSSARGLGAREGHQLRHRVPAGQSPVWFAPFPPELITAELIELFRDCADRAEHLRRAGARVVLVAGCELSLFNLRLAFDAMAEFKPG
jgi:hypothetical protein